MKILVCDRLLKDKPHSDWKEGWEFYYAFNNIGISCDIAGLDCPISETEIHQISPNYDFILVTENYPQASPSWKWWNWDKIKTPKMFWAIDTHTNNFNRWLQYSHFDWVGLNNKNDIDKYTEFERFYFPYGVSKRYSKILSDRKKYDITFIGGITQDRKDYLDKFNIKHITAFGDEYIKSIQDSKICFNKSISYDLNAKNLEIIAAGSFLLTNYNEHFYNFTKDQPLMKHVFYRDDIELKQKIDYYLKNEEEREQIAKKLQTYILQKHSYESRSEILINKIFKGK